MWLVRIKDGEEGMAIRVTYYNGKRNSSGGPVVPCKLQYRDNFSGQWIDIPFVETPNEK
jgi:hypothetical protein